MRKPNIARAIESVQAQSIEDWELICIDDGSTDKTPFIIQGFVGEDDRIRLISQANQGPAEARRKGYAAARGEFFIMLDADDWFGPDALSKLISEARRTGADGVVCRAMELEPETGTWHSYHERQGRREGELMSGKEAFELTFPWQIHGICLWRRSVVRTVAVDRDNAFNQFNVDEYLTRKLYLECAQVIVGTGEYFIYPNQDSITRKSTWRCFLTVQTDRRLTDLVLAKGVARHTVNAMILSQQQHLTYYLTRFVRFGVERNSRAVFAEICKSLLHCVQMTILVKGYSQAIILMIGLCKGIAHGILVRSSLLRGLYQQVRAHR